MTWETFRSLFTARNNLRLSPSENTKTRTTTSSTRLHTVWYPNRRLAFLLCRLGPEKLAALSPRWTRISTRVIKVYITTTSNTSLKISEQQLEPQGMLIESRPTQRHPTVILFLLLLKRLLVYMNNIHITAGSTMRRHLQCLVPTSLRHGEYVYDSV